MGSAGRTDSAKAYSPVEERINVVSHAIGLLLSIVALALMLLRVMEYGTQREALAVMLFGLGLISLYAASTAYHHARDAERRRRLRILDHAAIYLLIAGTYSPFALLTLQGRVGWTIFGISWLMAITGISLKLFFTGRYTLLSTLMYVFMGWIIVFAYKPLVENLSVQGLDWLIAGGLAYSVGAVVYMLSRINFNHAIFHLLILLGSFCHFIAVYNYVLPNTA